MQPNVMFTRRQIEEIFKDFIFLFKFQFIENQSSNLRNYVSKVLF